MRLFCTVAVLLVCHLSLSGQECDVRALRCEFLEAPLGIESSSPSLSWVIGSSLRGQAQTAYQVLVASSPEKLSEAAADLWNSGKTVSTQSDNVPYQGKPLLSGQQCYWKVRIWDTAGKPARFSEPSSWEMGLLKKDDWKGKWISAVPASDTTAPVLPAPFFRKELTVKKKPTLARFYISGLGYSEVYINGRKVSDRVLDPAVTRYDKHRKYIIHDVTSHLKAGKNVIGIILGNGWYNQHSETAWDFDNAPWRDSPCVLAQLSVTEPGGRTEVIGTDKSWKFAFGPITFNDVHNGEHYDARKELEGWSSPGYLMSNWKSAYEVESFGGVLSSQLMPPIRVTKSLSPVRSSRIGDTLVYDFGQNISGWVRLRVNGRNGGEVAIRHGERLNKRGTLDIRELSRFIFTGEVQTDRYTLKGAQTETWHPRFTYHGFQYAEVIIPKGVEVVGVDAEVVHTGFDDVGTFECSDTLLNRIHQNLKWSYLTNYHSYPTDCPHREKMGWTGDAHLVAEAGLFNFDALHAYRKWLDDFRDEQRQSGQLPGIIPTSGWGYTYGKNTDIRELGYGPQWEGAYLIIAWQLFRYTGDSSIISDHYATMKRYVDYLASNSRNNLISFGIDDHKQLRPVTDEGILSAGFYFHMVDLLSRMAGVAGEAADKKRYLALKEKIRAAFNGKYYDAATGRYGTGGQTQMSEPLYFGIVPESEKQKVVSMLREVIERDRYRVETGVAGTKFLVHALMNEGLDDILFKMISHTDFPGWGYWIKHGATTLWQNWDGTQSRNHVMFGSVVDYFYQGLAGIRPDDEYPGFRKFVIRPLLAPSLSHVSASYHCPYGEIRSTWRRHRTGLELQVSVPPNTQARIWFPVEDAADLREGGTKLSEAKGVIATRKVDGEVIVEVGSGDYVFNAENIKQEQ